MKKKLGSILCLTMLFVSMSIIGSKAAGNYHDTVFSFNFTHGGYTQFTSSRNKLDYTSSYMKCKYTSHSYSARVYGEDGWRIDVSKEHWYNFNTGTTRYLINFVKENGYPRACIGIESTDYNIYSPGFNANGLWSPDSI